jgi:hypothetical protein
MNSNRFHIDLTKTSQHAIQNNIAAHKLHRQEKLPERQRPTETLTWIFSHNTSGSKHRSKLLILALFLKNRIASVHITNTALIRVIVFIFLRNLLVGEILKCSEKWVFELTLVVQEIVYHKGLYIQ